MTAPEAAPLARATLFGREVVYETADALAEAGRLWPVTYALANVVAAEFPTPHALRGKTVVELGAGTAALSCALADAYDDATVVATDLPAVLPLLQRNAAHCRRAGSVCPLALPWGQPLATPLQPDVVLCCEVAYWGGWSLLAEDTRAPLRATLRELCGPATVLFFAFTVRDAARELGLVQSLVAEDGFSCRLAQDSAKLDGACEGDVLLLVMTRPQS